MNPLLWWGVNALWLLAALWATRVAYLNGKRDGFEKAMWLQSLRTGSHD